MRRLQRRSRGKRSVKFSSVGVFCGDLSEAIESSCVGAIPWKLTEDRAANSPAALVMSQQSSSSTGESALISDDCCSRVSSMWDAQSETHIDVAQTRQSDRTCNRIRFSRDFLLFTVAHYIQFKGNSTSREMLLREPPDHEPRSGLIRLTSFPGVPGMAGLGSRATQQSPPAKGKPT